MEPSLRDVVVLGSGPAGYTAALYAARAGLSTLVLAGAPTPEEPERVPGGQLVGTPIIENFPGFPEGIDGVELMERMRAQAERHGAEVWAENVVSVDFGARPFRVRGDEQSVRARAVIIATGASARWLHVPGETEYRSRGVFACATCDAPLVAGRDVVVVGGGDTALEEAIYLARFARSVKVVHRRDSLRATHALRARAAEHPQISYVWNSAVEAILGDGDRVTGVRTWDAQTAEPSHIATDAVFVAIGHTPATAPFGAELARDEHGYIVTSRRSMHTNIAGVFACGDVVDATYRQAITAAGSGAMAAIDAQRWLEGLRGMSPVRTAA